jgi:hypothetical protein
LAKIDSQHQRYQLLSHHTRPAKGKHALVHDPVNRANVYDDRIRDELADITECYRPLLCDRRMKRVWQELLSRQQGGAFCYPALPPPAPSALDRQHAALLEFLADLEGVPPPANTLSRQDEALIELFKVALKCRQGWCEITPTRGELKQERDECLATAEELRFGAFIRSQRDGNLHWERYQKLCDAAQALEDHAGEISFAGALEREGDRRGRWVALTIGNTLQRLFGSSMYGLTAIIASVVLGREIDPRTVRYWLNRPAVKPPKIDP